MTQNAWCWLTAAMLFGCGSPPAPAPVAVPAYDSGLMPLCLLGMTQACACEDGAAGYQTCNAYGAFDACACVASVGGSTTPACATGMSACGDTCFDLATNSEHCGSCRNFCGSGQQCVGGTCACPAGFTACTDDCVDLTSDPGACGSCENWCSDGELCVAGTCTCTNGLTVCADTCVDLQTDHENCGGCGQGCSSVQSCVAGICACPRGLTSCAEGCVDTTLDDDNCGACGYTCGPGWCVGGRCACADALTPCTTRAGGICADITSDPANCGACGVACGSGTPCYRGVCGCPESRTICDGAARAQCLDTTSDDNNCGGCNIRCPFGVSCIAGVCVCPSGMTACSGRCLDTATDLDNCGGCGVSCAGGTCTAGHCNCPGAMGMACGGRCTDASTNPLNCGACGNLCTGGMTCAAGHCGCPSTAPTLCGGTCTNPMSDASNCGACGASCPVACAGGRCTTVVAVAAGRGHACAQLADGSVSCWGESLDGELGSLVSSLIPVPIPGLSSVVEIAAGTGQNCARTSDGTVRCWGEDCCNELGYPVTTLCTDWWCSPMPQAIPMLTGVAQLALGDEVSCALMNDGTVQCWGADDLDQLGAPAVTNCTSDEGEPYRCSPSPTPVSGLTDVIQLAVSDEHACALRSDGTVWCWGAGWNGQLGYLPTTTCEDGDICGAVPAVVPGLAGVQAIAVSVGSTCAVLSGGTVQCWGDDSYGELGYEATMTCPYGNPCSLTPTTVPGLSGIASIAMGENHTCALALTGTVSCWGDDTYGQLGSGTTPTCIIAGSPADYCSLTPLAVPGLANVAQLAARDDFTCALGTDGSLRCWGDNRGGQIGNGSTTDAPTPSRVRF